MPLWRSKDSYMTAEDFAEWCAHCFLHRDDHAGNKCLYAPTLFAPIVDVKPGQVVPMKYRPVLAEFKRRLVEKKRHERRNQKRHPTSR